MYPELTGTPSSRPVYQKLVEPADRRGGCWASATVRADRSSVGRHLIRRELAAGECVHTDEILMTPCELIVDPVRARGHTPSE